MISIYERINNKDVKLTSWNNCDVKKCFKGNSMERRDILLKAFMIMLENYENDLEFCEAIEDCGKCPFYRWYTCPNQIFEEKE